MDKPHARDPGRPALPAGRSAASALYEKALDMPELPPRARKGESSIMGHTDNYTLLCDFYELTMGNGYFQTGMDQQI